MIDQERATEILQAEGLRPSAIRFLLKDFPTLDRPLSQAVEHWLSGNGVMDVEVKGISLLEVMQNHHNHFLAAVRELHLLLDESQSQEALERWKQYLRTPLSFE